MTMEENSPLTRREFLLKSSAGVAATGLMPFAVKATANPHRLRLAIVGTGSRGSTNWGRDLTANCGDVVEIVGLCDINGKRAVAARKLIGTQAPTFTDFDLMIATTKPDAVVVTTVDAIHSRYIVRALELGCKVITEKPLGTDEEQCLAILEAEKRLDKKIVVAFNARHFREVKKIKELLLESAIGDVISVNYHEYLDTDHGASYFRRWHRLKKNSGTLLVTKSCHHFDQVNWWLESTPVNVAASGELRIYGKNNSFRSAYCRACPFKQTCRFYWDITRHPTEMKLYAECESEDGYLRDGCVWREDVDIYDTTSVSVEYENKARLTYTTDAYLPYEGQAISINGSKGRIDFNSFSGGGFNSQELRLTRSFGKSELITDLPEQRNGGHGGADPSLQDMLFREPDGPDPLRLRAGARAGALASFVGIAAYKSIERHGQVVKISDLARI